jgi:RNA polymerase sigma-70 factor (ECF subfamily)
MNDLNVPTHLGPAERSFVYAVAFRILRDEDMAADATQDALLLAHRYRHQFRGDSAHRTWLYRIAVTTALGYLRRRRRRREDLTAGTQSVGLETPDPQPSPEQTVAAGELANAMRDALAEIGPRHREVFLLRLRDWTETEIARYVGITVANVKVRTHRARASLREALSSHGITPHITPRPVRPPSRAPRGSRAGSSATSRAS